MPRTPDPDRPARVVLPVRLYPSALASVEKLAEKQGLNRSEWSRRALAYAAVHMPAGWGDR